MSTFLPIFTTFICGMLLGAVYLNGVQRKITANLVDGRRIKIGCLLLSPDASRPSRGHFVIESGVWAWEPRSHENPLTLPADARPVRMRPPTGPERRRLNHRHMVMECASAQGDVLIAALNGQVEHVFMALTREEPEPGTGGRTWARPERDL